MLLLAWLITTTTAPLCHNQVALNYPPNVEKAIRQVFGRKLLASSLQTAAAAAETAGMDAVTLDGDEVRSSQCSRMHVAAAVEACMHRFFDEHTT